MKLFVLSKENPITVQEVLALAKPKSYEIIENLLTCQTRFNNYDRLAYTKQVHELLYEIKDMEEISSLNFQKHYKTNYRIRTHNTNVTEKYIAGKVWYTLKNPKVKLRNAKTEFHFYQTKKSILITKLIKTITHNFETRHPHNREWHPSTLPAKLARAMVNLTGIKKGTLLDPFCGTGGILIEAGLMNLKPVGFDIEYPMINKARKNMKQYKIK